MFVVRKKRAIKNNTNAIGILRKKVCRVKGSVRHAGNERGHFVGWWWMRTDPTDRPVDRRNKKKMWKSGGAVKAPRARGSRWRRAREAAVKKIVGDRGVKRDKLFLQYMR